MTVEAAGMKKRKPRGPQDEDVCFNCRGRGHWYSQDLAEEPASHNSHALPINAVLPVDVEFLADWERDLPMAWFLSILGMYTKFSYIVSHRPINFSSSRSRSW